MPQNEFISKNERAKLLNSLHRYVFWVGEQIPGEVEIDGEMVKLHEYIWKMLNKPELSDKNKECIERYITRLSEIEHEYETSLEKAELTPQDAKELFNRTAGLLRAIMDLKELEKSSKKGEAKHFHEHLVKHKVADAKRLVRLLDKLKK